MFGGKVIFIKKILMLAPTGVAQLVGQLSCKAEGGRLDSWSGLVPGLRFRPLSELIQPIHASSLSGSLLSPLLKKK